MEMRNTEINWRVPQWDGLQFMQLTIPPECVKEVEVKRGLTSVYTNQYGRGEALRAQYYNDTYEIKIKVDVSKQRMWMTESTIPLDKQIAPEENYTILDWLEIINGIHPSRKR